MKWICSTMNHAMLSISDDSAALSPSLAECEYSNRSILIIIDVCRFLSCGCSVHACKWKSKLRRQWWCSAVHMRLCTLYSVRAHKSICIFMAMAVAMVTMCCPTVVMVWLSFNCIARQLFSKFICMSCVSMDFPKTFPVQLPNLTA